MFTTTSKSLNSKRCGVSASRRLGPISGSASISENTLSMTSRSSFADSNEAPMAQESPDEGAGLVGEAVAGGLDSPASAGGLDRPAGLDAGEAAGFSAGDFAAAGFA